MYKLWGKKIKNHKILASVDVTDNKNISQDQKRNNCVGEICRMFDLSVPVWLDKHSEEFARFGHVTFFPADFIDEIDFERLEIELVDDGLDRR